jgi:ribonuclease E
VAVVSPEDGALVDLFCEEKGATDLVGNIYLGKVNNVMESISAYFVDFGAEKNGFLPFSSCNRPLKDGEMVQVQVRKNEKGNKGAKVSSFIKLAGKFNLYLPNGDKDSQGPSVHSKQTKASAEHIAEDLANLKKLWKQISGIRSEQPILLQQEYSLIGRMLRDRYAHEELEVIVEGEETFHRVATFMQELSMRMPLVQFVSEVPLLAQYGIFDQIRQTISNIVRLHSGGSIVIDFGEAMTCIDVNSGSYRGQKSIEETSYKVNLEAAAEIARQIRLRNLSGLLAIDFIDMCDRKHIESVEEAFKQEMLVGGNKQQMRILSMNEFCVTMLSRQRINQNLHHFFYSQCSITKGFYRNSQSMAFEILFEIRLSLISTKGEAIRVECPPNVADYLLNECRELLYMLELKNKRRIFIQASSTLISDFKIDPKHAYAMPQAKSKKPEQEAFVRNVIRQPKKVELPQKSEIFPPKSEDIPKIAEFSLPIGFFVKPYLTICVQDRVVLVDTT